MQQRRVEVRLFGRVLDEKYTRVLKTLPDLSLPDVMLLDAVQKGRPLSDEGTKTLRRKKLIEGRKPNLHVSERVADATGERVAYTRNRGLDKDYYIGEMRAKDGTITNRGTKRKPRWERV